MNCSRSISQPFGRALRRRTSSLRVHSSSLHQPSGCDAGGISSSSFSSSAFPDFPIPESVRESVKSSLLNEAVRGDSQWWRNDQQQDNNSMLIEGTAATRGGGGGGGGGVDTPIVSSHHDPLDDLYIQEATLHWPGLPPSVGVHQPTDPFLLAQPELDDLSRSIREDLIRTDHPVLNNAASYFFSASADGGKKIRPLMVLLLSRALSESFSSSESIRPCHQETTSASASGRTSSLLSAPLPGQRPDLPQAQRRLAEISEMIHTASLFHDDVIDGAGTRRGVPAVHAVFGNKMAILAGDYLLARASICLARLRDVRVVETMSTIIEHLVRGEVMQMRGTTPEERSNERIVYYLRKNYYKTASLMANSCKSAALLGEYPLELVDASYRFGKHVGMAFQLVDDVLDFEGTLSQLGKPSLSDLKAGLATAPVLFAAEEFAAELLPLMNRKFNQDGDVDRARQLVYASRGMERTKELARVHAECAMQAILESFGPSEYRDSLVYLSHKVVARTK